MKSALSTFMPTTNRALELLCSLAQNRRPNAATLSPAESSADFQSAVSQVSNLQPGQTIRVGPINGSPQPVALIDAPAFCEVCRCRYVSPTTGKVADRCHCGGRLISDSQIENRKSEFENPSLTYDEENTALQIGRLLITLHERITRFQREKFPHQPLRAKLTHLVREANELRDCNGMDHMEFADVFLLTLGCSDVEGIPLLKFLTNAHDKLTICETREWHPPDADGVHHHKD
jgi:hypothetical protein